MARRNRSEPEPETVSEPSELETLTNDDTEKELASVTDTSTAAVDYETNEETPIGGGEADEEEEIGVDDPTDYEPILWPARKEILCYVSRCRSFTGKDPEKSSFGESFCAVEFTAREDQLDPELLDIAGQTFEPMAFSMKRGKNGLYQAFVLAMFGQLRKFRPSEVLNKAIKIVVRHGKGKDRDTGIPRQVMYIEKMLKDSSVE